ncbi:MAG: hypothetical protein IPJ24_07465 [bacterium]|nr:hypothetical protein [bacterium]
MAWNGKKLAGLGCGVLVLGAIVVAGALTWYSTQLSREYKKVQKSEQALIAATAAPMAFAPPADGVPGPDRLEAFLGVRTATAEWRQRLAAEDRRFAGSAGNWWSRAGGANDLAQVLAAFWIARNEALLAAKMGPGEYVWLYGLVYHGWLGHDTAAGRRPDRIVEGNIAAGDKGAGDARFSLRREQWREGVAPASAAVLEPLREQLVAGWNEETNPVELIFVADDAPANGAAK